MAIDTICSLEHYTCYIHLPLIKLSISRTTYKGFAMRLVLSLQLQDTDRVRNAMMFTPTRNLQTASSQNPQLEMMLLPIVHCLLRLPKPGIFK